jgi:cell wall-active antibiotic response 4TMS protein YvqF
MTNDPLSDFLSHLVPPQRLDSVMSSVEQRGPWEVAPQLASRVLCGNLVLDLRDARFTAAGTTIEIHVTMGNLEVIVPPGMGVEVEASSLFANIEDRSEPAPSARVRIVGSVKLGNLEVCTMEGTGGRHGGIVRDRSARVW